MPRRVGKSQWFVVAFDSGFDHFADNDRVVAAGFDNLAHATLEPGAATFQNRRAGFAFNQLKTVQLAVSNRGAFGFEKMFGDVLLFASQNRNRENLPVANHRVRTAVVADGEHDKRRRKRTLRHPIAGESVEVFAVAHADNIESVGNFAQGCAFGGFIHGFIGDQVLDVVVGFALQCFVLRARCQGALLSQQQLLRFGTKCVAMLSETRANANSGAKKSVGSSTKLSIETQATCYNFAIIFKFDICLPGIIMSTRTTTRRSDDAFERNRLRRQRRKNGVLGLAAAGGIAFAAAFFARESEKSPNIVTKAQAASVFAPKPKPKPSPKPTWQDSIPNWSKSKVIEHVPVKSGQKVIALTFDDGPWPDYSVQVLALLKEYNAKATFYVVGQEVARRPQIARQMRDAGHSIGNHSWDHPMRPRDPVAQVVRTNAVIKRELGIMPTTFRPPYGLLGNGMARKFMKDGGAVIIWSADSDDWKRPGSARIASKVLREASSGGIVLMHDGGGNRTQTVAALRTVLRVLDQRGYKFVTVPQLLKMRYVAPKTAKKAAAKTKTKAPAKKP